MLDILIETESASGESAQIPIEMQVAASGQPGEIRIGNEVPIPVTSFVSPNGTAGGIPQTPVTSFQYRNVGLNINLSAVPVENAFRLTLQIEQSSEKQGRTIGGVELPVFGTTTYNHETTLRDGESRELATVKDSDGGTIRHIRLALRVLP